MSTEQLKVYEAATKENMVTVLATLTCIVGVAFATGSLHCFWGLLILLNLNLPNSKGRNS